MSLRKLHNNLSLAYHFIFSNPTTFEIINELDKQPPEYFIKSLVIDNINTFLYNERVNILQKMNLFEENENIMVAFSNIINDIFFLSLGPIHTFVYKDVLKYYIIGFLYQNYLLKFNKLLTIIRSSKITTTQKDELYLLLVKDFIIEINITILNDIWFKHLFKTDLSSSSFSTENNTLNNLKTFFSKSNEMIKLHDENLTALFLQHEI